MSSSHMSCIHSCMYFAQPAYREHRNRKRPFCSEPRPGTNLRRAKDLAARLDDGIPEPTLKPFHRERLARNKFHSIQLRLKALQKLSE